MNWFTGLLRKLSMLLRRERFRSELDEEMAYHRAQAEKDFVTDGMTPKQARAAAARQFGNAAKLREESHEAVSFRWETVTQDLRFAMRQLRRNPGFAATAVVILAMGIAASVAIFGFVDATLIKPLPYNDPSRLAMLFEGINLGPRFHLSYLDYLDWKKQNSSFSTLDVFSASNGFMLQTPNGPQATDGVRISAGFFRTLGVAPMLGRDFYPNEDAPSAPRTALLSYGAWQNRYGGRREVLGQSIVLDGATVTIIGVLPRTFHFAPAEPAEFWVSENASSTCAAMRACHDYFGIGRLKDGASFASAYADVKTIQERLQRQYPDAGRDRVAFLLPLTEVIAGDIRPILLVLMSGAALLLVIACVNVASLLLVRSESRRREVAVRGALGASVARLMRQFVTEGLLLAAAGSLIGAVAGTQIMGLLTRILPSDMLATMPYLREAGLNLRVATFAVFVFLVTSLLFALTPALRLSLNDMRDGLSDGARGSAGTLWKRFGINLVVIEIATAMVLLVGAGLLGKSLYKLLHSETGISPDHLALMDVSAVGNTYQKDAQQVQLEQEITRQIGSLPGVSSIGITSHLPLGDGDGASSFHRLDLPYLGVNQEVAMRSVTSGYLPALQARILRGRNFRADEDQTKPRVAIINLTLARQYFPGTDPLGKRIVRDGEEQTPIDIVGIVDDLQEGQLDAAPRAAMYRPFDQYPDNGFAVVVRTAQTEDTLLPDMTAAVHRIDAGLAVARPTTMGKRIHDSPSAYLHRTSAWMVGGFAAMALLLSVVGLYGVVAYSVSQRTREIGVRMALGAQRGSVYRLILKEAGWLTSIGIVLGLVCSVAAASLMRKLLFGTQAWDVSTLAVVAVVLGGAAMLASYIPARRAAGVNPVEALRAE